MAWLIEELGVNVDMQRGQDSDASQDAVSIGAIHELAAARHWWHVHQALPYLTKNGASLELRDQDGKTALHIAPDCSTKKGEFYMDAVRILLKSERTSMPWTLQGRRVYPWLAMTCCSSTMALK